MTSEIKRLLTCLLESLGTSPVAGSGFASSFPTLVAALRCNSRLHRLCPPLRAELEQQRGRAGRLPGCRGCGSLGVPGRTVVRQARASCTVSFPKSENLEFPGHVPGALCPLGAAPGGRALPITLWSLSLVGLLCFFTRPQGGCFPRERARRRERDSPRLLGSSGVPG